MSVCCGYTQVHKPDCFEAQGKPVSDKVRQAAEQVMAQREQDSFSEFTHQVERAVENFMDEDASLVDSLSFNCFGERRRVDIPTCYAETILSIYATPHMATPDDNGFTLEDKLHLGIHPEGIPQDLSGRGLLLSCPGTGAKLMVLYEHLFNNGGDKHHPTAEMNGLSLDGIYVVDKVKMKRGKKEAVWKRVVDDRTAHPPGSNRFQRVGFYMAFSKTQARAVERDVDLGIHQSNLEQLFNIHQTANGIFLSTS